MRTYFYTYICSLALALVMTPVTIWLAHKFNIMDPVDARKIHSKPIPRIGGIVIFISTSVLLIVVMLLNNDIGEGFRRQRAEVLTLLSCGGFIFLIGLIDDLRQLKARHKLLAQVAAAAALALAGIRIETINVAGLFTVDLGWFSYLVTILWIIAITNAVNLIDGLDGLAAGICAIACATVAVCAFSAGQTLMVVLMLAVLGGISGFLFFNFNPARIFMGDCGSMFLGFILASGSVMCAFKSKTIVALALPVLALGLAIFDTAFSILRRYLGRWGIMSPDRGHLHHRLIDMGLRQRDAVIIMYAITAIAAGLGLFMMITTGGGTIAVFLCVVFLLILVFRAFGAVRLREVVKKVRYNNRISKKARRDTKIFENTYLKLSGNVSFKQQWEIISEIAEKVDFSELSMTITKNSRQHKFLWQSNKAKDDRELVRIKLPIDQEKLDMPVEIEAKMHINDSLESCGRRMMLFGRLIDEYGFSDPAREVSEEEFAGLTKTKKPAGSDQVPAEVSK